MTWVEWATMLVLCACLARYVLTAAYTVTDTPHGGTQPLTDDDPIIEPDGWDEALRRLLEWEALSPAGRTPTQTPAAPPC
jgi:hypothetical protein